MDKSFSDTDMQRYIRNVIVYEDLANYTPNKLLSMLPLVILYQVEKDYGHWTLLHRVKGSIEFFDSYGFKPDREFEFIPENMQQPKYIARMLCSIIDHEPVSYNQYHLQERKRGVNTCGRWVVVREMFGNVDIDTFANGIDTVCVNMRMSPDELVVRLTS